MHAHFLLFAQATLGTLDAVLNRVGYLTHGLLDRLHADEAVQVGQDAFERTFFRHVAPDVAQLHLYCLVATTNIGGKNVLGSLDGHMGVAEGFVLDFYLVLEEARQLFVGIVREGCYAVFHLQLQLHNVAQLLEVIDWQAEHVLKAVLHGRITLKEVVQSLRKSRNDYDGIVVPPVHFHKELVERIDLIGILVGQQFLHIVEEQDAPPCLLDVLVPFVHKALIVHRIDHSQLGRVNNLTLIEVVADNAGKRRLACARLTYDNSV